MVGRSVVSPLTPTARGLATFVGMSVIAPSALDGKIVVAAFPDPGSTVVAADAALGKIVVAAAPFTAGKMVVAPVPGSSVRVARATFAGDAALAAVGEAFEGMTVVARWPGSKVVPPGRRVIAPAAAAGKIVVDPMTVVALIAWLGRMVDAPPLAAGTIADGRMVVAWPA